MPAGPARDIESGRKTNSLGKVTGPTAHTCVTVVALLFSSLTFLSYSLSQGFDFFFFLTSAQLGELGFTQRTVSTARSSKAAPAPCIFGQSGKVLLLTKIENRTFSTS